MLGYKPCSHAAAVAQAKLSKFSSLIFWRKKDLIENGIPNITVENDKIYAHEKLTLLKCFALNGCFENGIHTSCETRT